MDKFKEGRITILKLIRLFDEDGKKDLKIILVEDYSFPRDEAMDISDLISQLSSLKSDHEDWFEEYPLSELIDLDSSSSQPTTTPISSSQSTTPPPNDHNRHPSFPNLRFKRPLMNQLNINFNDGFCALLDAEDENDMKDVKVKIGSDLEKFKKDHSMLRHLFSKNRNSQKIHFIKVTGTLHEHFMNDPSTNQPLHAMVMEKGEENLDEFLKSDEGLNLNDFKKVDLALDITLMLDQIHSSQIVWMDMKSANIVRFFRGVSWRAINFDHALHFGDSIPHNHGCTYQFAPPELVRHLTFQEGSLSASPSIDTWSLGVIIVQIKTGQHLLHNLGKYSLEDIIEFYCQKNDTDIQSQIDSFLGGIFRDGDKGIFSLVSDLLQVNPSQRITIQEALHKKVFTAGKTQQNRIGEVLDNQQRILNNQDIIFDNQDEMKENQEEMIQRMGQQKSNIQELLSEVRSNFNNLSEEDEDIYTDIRKSMRKDNQNESQLGEYEELRRILNK